MASIGLCPWGLDGATQLLQGARLRRNLVVGLINRGLVMTMYETVRAGSTMIDVTKVLITHEGHKAIEG